jgi:hypothetical protein
MMPVTFEHVESVASKRCQAALGEGRAAKIALIWHKAGDIREDVTIAMTYDNARDLVCSLIALIGVTTEYRSMRLFRGVLEALDDCQTDVEFPGPSAN